MLAASVNPNCGAWALSPVATEIEKQAVQWIAELVGYASKPRSAPRTTAVAGLLVSGGNMANMVCLLAGLRAQVPGKRTAGLSSKLRVYASSEVHTWLVKAADIVGIARS